MAPFSVAVDNHVEPGQRKLDIPRARPAPGTDPPGGRLAVGRLARRCADATRAGANTCVGGGTRPMIHPLALVAGACRRREPMTEARSGRSGAPVPSTMHRDAMPLSALRSCPQHLPALACFAHLRQISAPDSPLPSAPTRPQACRHVAANRPSAIRRARFLPRCPLSPWSRCRAPLFARPSPGACLAAIASAVIPGLYCCSASCRHIARGFRRPTASSACSHPAPCRRVFPPKVPVARSTFLMPHAPLTGRRQLRARLRLPRVLDAPGATPSAARLIGRRARHCCITASRASR